MTERPPAQATIVVAFHRPCRLPEDALHLPVSVSGDACGTGHARDDGGENIADKNPWYNELTALYWAWKNLDAAHLGLAHYRRYFTLDPPLWGKERAWRSILNREQALRLLETQPIILPKARRYYIETKYNQFARAHGEDALCAARRVIQERRPEYLPAWKTSMARTSGHIFNMFVMRRDLLDAYCAWLFDILFATEDALQKTPGGVAPRLMGFLGERLLDVWLETHTPRFVELPVVNTEGVNWPAKIGAFLLRKARGGKSNAS